jgi:cytoskeletal protein RodZ
MSDVQDSLDSGSSISARLRAAREERGLSLDDIAAKTRIPVRHLNAIEQSDWDSLPAITYSVGFVRSYANVVGLNGTQLGQELREQLGGGPAYATGATYEPADPARVPPRSLAIIAGLLALALAIGYFIWRASSVEEPDMLAQATTEQAAPEQPAPAAAPAAQQPLAGPAAAPAAATGPVVLTAISDVWVRIYDGQGGPTLMQGQMKAGDTFQVPATAQKPMIRTARAEALSVKIGSTEKPQLGPPGSVSGLSLLPQDLGGGPAAATPPARPPAASVPQPAAPLTE